MTSNDHEKPFEPTDPLLQGEWTDLPTDKVELSDDQAPLNDDEDDDGS